MASRQATAPRYLTGQLAKIWQQMYDEAVAAGVNPETTAVIVVDENKKAAVEALVAMGGASSVETPEGLSVQLVFDQPGGNVASPGLSPSVAAAARPTSFA